MSQGSLKQHLYYKCTEHGMCLRYGHFSGQYFCTVKSKTSRTKVESLRDLTDLQICLSAAWKNIEENNFDQPEVFFQFDYKIEARMTKAILEFSPWVHSWISVIVSATSEKVSPEAGPMKLTFPKSFCVCSSCLSTR